MKSLPQNPDVVVVGAGTAGLAAADALQKSGLSVLTIEASDEVGGRCITDSNLFSVPFDRGGAWMHSASVNPLAQIAEQSGERLHKAQWIWSRVHIQGQNLTEQEVADYRTYQDAIWESVEATRNQTFDAAIDKVLPENPWRETAQHSVAQMLSADADVASAQDAATYHQTNEDWLIAGGLGAFVHRLHSGIDVVCSCPATKIDYSGPRIKVTTPKGTVEADHVILTVSSAILSTGRIRFHPELPQEKYAAANDLPLGLLNKVGIEFDAAWRDAVEAEMMDYHSGDTEFCSILFGFMGSTLATGFVAGRYADTLEKEGKGAATAYCLEALHAFFGSDIQKRILRMEETAWRGNENTLGSYSYARPGRSNARTMLAAPVSDRLFFAGEATMATSYSTVHGAYLSGCRAAEEINALRVKSNRPR